MTLKNLLQIAAEELYVANGDRPITVNDVRAILTGLIEQLARDEEKTRDRLARADAFRKLKELSEPNPTTMFDPDSL
jgi:hypothetical protein